MSPDCSTLAQNPRRAFAAIGACGREAWRSRRHCRPRTVRCSRCRTRARSSGICNHHLVLRRPSFSKPSTTAIAPSIRPSRCSTTVTTTPWATSTARGTRVLLSRPSRWVRAYRTHVDAMIALLGDPIIGAAVQQLLALGINLSSSIRN